MATATSVSQLPGSLPEPPPRLELNGPAPDFEANTTHGPIKLSDLYAISTSATLHIFAIPF